jgi:hypothetical protein
LYLADLKVGHSWYLWYRDPCRDSAHFIFLNCRTCGGGVGGSLAGMTDKEKAVLNEWFSRTTDSYIEKNCAGIRKPKSVDVSSISVL